MYSRVIIPNELVFNIISLYKPKRAVLKAKSVTLTHILDTDARNDEDINDQKK